MAVMARPAAAHGAARATRNVRVYLLLRVRYHVVENLRETMSRTRGAVCSMRCMQPLFRFMPLVRYGGATRDCCIINGGGVGWGVAGVKGPWFLKGLAQPLAAPPPSIPLKPALAVSAARSGQTLDSRGAPGPPRTVSY